MIFSASYVSEPKHPFPVGLNDSWDALVWVSEEGEREIGIDPKRIAIMGTSAGANFAAVLAQRACLASPRIPLVFQPLLVPALNLNLSTVERDNGYLFWFIDLYVPNVHDRTKPEVCPALQEDKLAFDGMPPTLVSVAELDVLCSEGEMYAEKLQSHGVPVISKALKGLPHTGAVADRVCAQVHKYHEDLIEALKQAFA
ncbi:unnamed protein product [Rhizoctonia solani]|uniref:Alpha/beta hydrolase fold-3 domain-containing protein n=1 Tax=Rhizoctonia solani TaxID=456999 RepID=A0A8H3E9K5_9AGAM|nr:unnamed protein product [Rhizoctonia solani]